MISRDALVTKLARLLDHDYVALLGQRGDEIHDVITHLRSVGIRRGLRFLSLSLPTDVTDPVEFQELVLEGLIEGAERLPRGTTVVESVTTHLRELGKRTPRYRIEAVLKFLGRGTSTGRLVIVVDAQPEVAEDRLKELLRVMSGFHGQRDHAGEPGDRLRFLVFGSGTLWRLCFHRKRDRSPFNVAMRVLVGGLDDEELARRFARRSAKWLSRLRAISDGAVVLVRAIDNAGGDLDDLHCYFGAIQDHWNALPAASRNLLEQHISKGDLGDCIPDYGCEGVPEVDSPSMEAFWHGFLRTQNRRLCWRSEIHRAFVAARAPTTARPVHDIATPTLVAPPRASKMPMKVFISYSRDDKRWLRDFKAQFKAPEREGLISYWLDVQKLAGTQWEREIRVAINEARVAILLVSPFFLASDFIARKEIPRILRLARRGGLIVMPVILTSCRFAETKALSRYQAFNSPDEPLDKMRRPKRMEVLRDLTNRVLAFRESPTM